MSGSLVKAGIGKETVYGTAVAPTVPLEIISEDIRGSYPRLQAESLSAGLVDRSDRWVPNAKGATGSLSLEPFTKGFGNWLGLMMGGIATSGPAETSVYTHIGTIADLGGKNFTLQIGRPDEAGVRRPWTYEGGKVTSFEFSNSVDQTLRASISMDFEKESNPDAPSGVYALTALEALSLPTNAEVLQWQGGTITLDAGVIEVSEISVRVDNALNTNRWFIGGASTKKEPRQDGKRSVEFTFRTPYVNNDFWQKVSSSTASGAVGVLKAKWSGLVLLGTTIYPSLELEIPVARFDEGGPVVSGPSQLEQTMSGRGLWNGTDSALTVRYQSADATVLS